MGLTHCYKTTVFYIYLGNETRIVYDLSTGAIRRDIRSGLCDPHQLSRAELVAAADDDLFFQVMYNDKHVLNCLLAAKTERTYQLRNRRHNRSLLAKVGSITESDVIMRQLYKDVYSRLFIFYLFYFYSTDHYLYWLPFVNL